MTTTYGSDIPGIKVETPMNGQTPYIKPESDSRGASPAAHADDDLYEDAGDLEFAGADQGLYLTRVPKFLWERWSQLDDNQDVTIGKVRVEGGPDNVKRVDHSAVSLVSYRYLTLTFMVADEHFVVARRCTESRSTERVQYAHC